MEDAPHVDEVIDAWRVEGPEHLARHFLQRLEQSRAPSPPDDLDIIPFPLLLLEPSIRCTRCRGWTLLIAREILVAVGRRTRHGGTRWRRDCVGQWCDRRLRSDPCWLRGLDGWGQPTVKRERPEGSDAQAGATAGEGGPLNPAMALEPCVTQSSLTAGRKRLPPEEAGSGCLQRCMAQT